MNKLPPNLLAKQEQQRQQTINLVLKAISELKTEGHVVKIKMLMEYTGLSRSVFGKSHIRQILIQHDIVSADTAPAPSRSEKKASSKQKLMDKLKEKDEYIRRLCEENTQLKSECELLRGKLFLLMQRQSTY